MVPGPSIVMFSAIYALLFAVWVFVINAKIVHGPDDAGPPPDTTAPQGLIESIAFRAQPHGHTFLEES